MSGKLKKSYVLKGFVIFYVFSVLLFFTSKSWYPGDGALIPSTNIGTGVTFANRDFMLKRWDYSPEQELMELEFQMTDHSTDGIKALYYEAVEKKTGKLNVKTVYEENNLILVRIENVPEKFKEISFRIKLKPEDENVLKFYTNKSEVNRVARISDKKEEQYYIAREEKNILAYEKQMKQHHSDIESFEEKIDNANLNITKLMAGKKYQTEAEQLDTDDAIKILEDNITTYQKNIADLDVEIRELEEKIELSKQKISEYSHQIEK